MCTVLHYLPIVFMNCDLRHSKNATFPPALDAIEATPLSVTSSGLGMGLGLGFTLLLMTILAGAGAAGVEGLVLPLEGGGCWGGRWGG
jgi:hypothetical protein